MHDAMHPIQRLTQEKYSHLYWDIWSDVACWMTRVHALLNLVLVKVRDIFHASG